jgi:hypothetical protein
MPRHQVEDLRQPIVKWIESGIIGCLFLTAISAPHSIAATQTAWLVGLVLSVLRFALFPRPKLFRSPVDYALIGFFLISGLSGVFSYSPIVSIGKMRAASLFTIVYLVSQNVNSIRLARLLTFALIGSSMLGVFLTAGQLVIGRGVKVEGVKTESVLTKANFHTRTVSKLTPIINRRHHLAGRWSTGRLTGRDRKRSCGRYGSGESKNLSNRVDTGIGSSSWSTLARHECVGPTRYIRLVARS